MTDDGLKKSDLANWPMRDILYGLRYRTIDRPPATSSSDCKCGRASGRGGRCIQCYADELARRAGKDVTARHITALRDLMKTEIEIMREEYDETRNSIS